MALQTTTEIYIASRPIASYVSLSLTQELAEHHDLNLVCRTDVLETLSGELIGESKDFLGETITLKVSSFSMGSGYKDLEFKGVITGISSEKGFQQSSGDLIVIKAKSCSILSDDGPHYASYTDKNLSEILEQAFQGYDRGKLETSFTPQNSEAIGYTVQYKQSSFDFAKRLAAYHGEWFYDDGKLLVFGQPSTEELELAYGSDLSKFTLDLNTSPILFQYLTDDYVNDSVYSKGTSGVSTSSEGHHGFMGGTSKSVFPKETIIHHTVGGDKVNQSNFDKQVENHTKAQAVKQVLAKGVSDNPGIHLGKVIKVTGYGSFRITKISHNNIEGGSYSNEFEAVDAAFDASPLSSIEAYPKSEVQTAKVIDNIDPEGLSRIKVQFPWQKVNGETTPWLRMMTPHAGGDKGFHFIPEIGEEVLVGFTSGNVEAPYVAGALYNGSEKADSWQTAKNDIKAIRTRSGHTIELNDTKDGEYITITDKNKNLITIDTVGNNITISAGENMTFNAKNMQINVDENLDVSVGKSKTENIGEDHLIISKNEERQVSESLKIISSEFKQEAQEISTDASGEIKTNAGGKITIASAETVEYGE